MNIDNEDFFADNFFVISSENLDLIKPRLYGYCFLDEKICINSENCNYYFPEENYGCWVNIVKTKDNKLNIYQDYFGSYGLYLYNKDNFFAISNSFLYLVNYLSTRKKLSYDWEYAQAFLAAPQASLLYTDTMVNEITMLPKNSRVEINSQEKTISISHYEQKEKYINIDSKEGINIIDAWHSKWNKCLKQLIEDKQVVSFGLSGGKDSRVSLACLFHPTLNLDSVFFESMQDNLHTHGDDYEIASSIAEIYKFGLNKARNHNWSKIDGQSCLSASLFAKCGFHREVMPKNFWRNKITFHITGSGGDLRDLWEEPAENFINRMVSHTVFNELDFRNSLRRKMLNSKSAIDTDIGDTSKFSATDYFYKHGRQRNHNGKANVEFFLSNMVICSPLMDAALYKLNQDIGKNNDNDLLYALIYDRFLPEINHIDFDSNRIVKKETKQIAHQINKNFPLKKSETTNKILNVDISQRKIPYMHKGLNGLDVLKEAFYSDKLKQFVCQYFSEEVWIRADNYYKNSYNPYIAASGLLQTYIIYNAVKLSNTINNYSIVDFPNKLYSRKNKENYYNSGIIKEIFDYLQSIRIEIKNSNTENNDIKILDYDDKNIFFERPKWFADNKGKGIVLQSYKSKLRVTFQTKINGKLYILAKIPYILDGNNKQLPIKTDVLQYKLIDVKTSNTIFTENNIIQINSDNNLSFELDCADEQMFCLNIEWLPYAYTEEELVSLFHEMKLKSVDYFKFWKQAKGDFVE